MEQKLENALYTRNSMLDDPDRSLTALLDNTSKLLTRCLEMELKPYEISLPKIKVLALLSAVDDTGATLQELAKWTFRELNSVSVLIRSMEADGLVRKEVTAYKVSNRYFLTELGHKMKDALAIGTKASDMVFDCLTPAEQEALRTYLHKIQKNAEGLLGLNYVPPFLD